MVALLVRRQEVPVEVDFHGWALQDWDDENVPSTFPDGFKGDAFLTAFQGRLDFASAGHTHTANLTVEVWDGEPSSVAGDWDEVAEASIACESGRLRAWAVAGGPMPETIELSDQPRTWAVRALCTGRREVAELAQTGVPEGVERYTVQFWPAA
ncbi:hypothetical protein EASAB2608_06535 [Streptomyces sp. EAS-AB2608]|nr:hypothetical protein EASAB2608_06535 [Streptomyces sp. EAS-AB2608]